MFIQACVVYEAASQRLDCGTARASGETSFLIGSARVELRHSGASGCHKAVITLAKNRNLLAKRAHFVWPFGAIPMQHENVAPETSGL